MRGARPSWWSRRCSGRDEEDNIDALGTVRAALTEGRKAGAIDFFFGGANNIQPRLGNAGEDLHGLDSIEWYGLYGPECKGGGDDTITDEKKIRRPQPPKEPNCTITSTWTKNDDNCQFHTWRAWGSQVCKKPLDQIMRPRDLRSTTW